MVEPNCVVQNGGTLGRDDPDIVGCALGIIDTDMDDRFDVVDMREGND